MTPAERAALAELTHLIDQAQRTGRPLSDEEERGIDWAEGIAEERAWERGAA